MCLFACIVIFPRLRSASAKSLSYCRRFLITPSPEGTCSEGGRRLRKFWKGAHLRCSRLSIPQYDINHYKSGGSLWLNYSLVIKRHHAHVCPTVKFACTDGTNSFQNFVCTSENKKLPLTLNKIQKLCEHGFLRAEERLSKIYVQSRAHSIWLLIDCGALHSQKTAQMAACSVLSRVGGIHTCYARLLYFRRKCYSYRSQQISPRTCLHVTRTKIRLVLEVMLRAVVSRRIRKENIWDW